MKRILVILYISALIAMHVSCSNNTNNTSNSDQNMVSVEAHANKIESVSETNRNNEITENMPVFEIVTENSKPVTSKEKYIKGSLTVNGSRNGFELTSEPLQIRGRGNHSWTVDKKSFRIKFDKKINLLNQGKQKAKSWTLLANQSDKSLLRNDAAYFFASKLKNIPFVSSSSFVDLYLNGVYLGVYEVCEQIQVNKARVDIDDTGMEDDIGYLVELSQHASEDVIKISNGDTFEIKSNFWTQSQMNFITDYLSKSYEAILTKNKQFVEQFIDLPSAIDTYIVEELFKNPDVGWGSFYFTKPKGGKLYFGPVWDFDTSAGNLDGTAIAAMLENVDARAIQTIKLYQYTYVGNKSIMLYLQNHWFVALRKCDWFNELVKIRWNEIRPHAYKTVEHIGEIAKKYKKSFKHNSLRWYIGARTKFEPEEVLAIDSFEGQVEYLQNWLLNRIEWLTDYYAGKEKDWEPPSNAGSCSPGIFRK